MNDQKNSAKGNERAQAQRDRILKAAEKIFIKHGFHAASMSEIAQEAEMSPGLIYRYYPGKDDIILAIIELQLEEARETIQKLYADSDMAQSLYDFYNQLRLADPKIMNAALFAEMTAEGTRNPVLAQAMRSSDMAVRAEVVKWLSTPICAGGRGLPKNVAYTRAIMLDCFVEGLAIRAIREPGLDQDEMMTAIRDFVTVLFPNCM